MSYEGDIIRPTLFFPCYTHASEVFNSKTHFFCVPTPCFPSSFLLSETDERLHDDEDDDDCDDDLAKRHVSHAADKKPKKKKAKAGGIPAIS